MCLYLVFTTHLWGSMPPNPPAMRMASPCAKCRFATCKFPNLEKIFLPPPLPNPGYAPDASDTLLLAQITTKSIHLYTIEQNWGKSSLWLYAIGSGKGVGGHLLVTIIRHYVTQEKWAHISLW